MFWLFKSQIIGAREVNNNKDARPGERERGREANSDISTRYPFLILHSSKRLPIDEENLPGPLMVPGFGTGMPRRYSAAHEDSIHQDERNLLRTGKRHKRGGELVSETGGWRSRSDTERYE